MKKHGIVAAISAVLASPLTVPVAFGDVVVSGSMKTGVAYEENKWAIVDNGSALAFEVDHNMGEDQTVFALLEFNVDSAKGSILSGEDEGVTVVGLTGDWGLLSLGTQDSTLNSVVGGFMDVGERYSGSAFLGQGSMMNSAFMAMQVGQIEVMGDLQMNSNGEDIDSATIGGLFEIGEVAIGVAYQNNDGSDDYSGVGAAINLSGIDFAGGYNEMGSDNAWAINTSVAGLTVEYDQDGVGVDSVTATYALELSEFAFVVAEWNGTGSENSGIVFLQMDF